ncbi:MAG TPA: carbamoyltransferase HypF [Polyangiales bacterium]|nr:carbamoyltransferase HypF [Polyangiales bacterium]
MTVLPAPAPRCVLAFGAYLKNTLCLLNGSEATLSAVHGDLGTPEACAALARSAEMLVERAGGAIEVVAHDLHPDFESTRLAQAWAERLDVPALAVQHHHAHIGVVQAELGSVERVVGLALDGVGLGSDRTIWGGELLLVRGQRCSRLGALTPIALPGGDIAAREPWRMAAAALHALERSPEIVPRLRAVAGADKASMIARMLERRLQCPISTSAGRWFDAVAGLLGVSVRQAIEAEAAMALERLASDYLQHHPEPAWRPQGLELRPLMAALLAHHDAAGESGRGEAAALFHVGLARALVVAAAQAASTHGARLVALGGGCFFNRVLSERVTRGLAEHDLASAAPAAVSCGDAGLALGQAWIAAHALAAGEAPQCA